MADLQPIGATESDADPAFDRIARVAARALNTPIALITLLDEEQRLPCRDRFFFFTRFRAACGLPADAVTR